MTDLPKEEAGSPEARWAWAVVLIITPIAIVMFEHESFTYALGSTTAGITFGFLLSPVWRLISRPFSNLKWRWYHWFNSAAFTALVLKIGYWTLVPMGLIGGS
jgi:hypothetical protein